MKWLMALMILTTAAEAEVRITKDSMGYTHYSGSMNGKSHEDSMGYRHYDLDMGNDYRTHCLSHKSGNQVTLQCGENK